MRRVVAVAVVAVCAVLAAPAYAAAPRYILVSGPGLTRPVLLGDWQENLRFLESLLPARKLPAFRLAGRPRYDLALFWGVPAKPIPTRPRDANQHARFYPNTGGREFRIIEDPRDTGAGDSLAFNFTSAFDAAFY